MSSTETHKQNELIEQQITLNQQQITLNQQQIKNTQETHCVFMLWKYNKAIQYSTSDDERELFHNLRASVFLELKELRNV
tara:strand:- start:167 stop:406 length:240 start_codon:yes stop_codon:yes gene_type:complete